MPNFFSTEHLEQRLKAGLAKTQQHFRRALAVLLADKVDDTTWESLETLLISADVGVSATQQLVSVTKSKFNRQTDVRTALRTALLESLLPLQQPLIINQQPFVIMLVGVNGTGKTTSIGKLAHHFLRQNKTVLIVAGDTFRAAAREQLAVWGERSGVQVMSHASQNIAAIMFDAVHSARAKGIHVVLADTAGRLPTQLNLMQEIIKAKRVLGKALDGAPHEILLVLDANTGQNAVTQVRAFDDALG
ncbi:MAG: signaling recognition particle receptor family protein, partial [Methylophilaceae bacterium]|nr:signaling recognition particle receptor family protein [Methylophilaceae bacterium]